MIDERLRAQIAYLESDERLRERARVALESSPQERLAIAAELCRAASAMLERLSPDERARWEGSRERPDAEAAVALRRLGGGAT